MDWQQAGLEVDQTVPALPHMHGTCVKPPPQSKVPGTPLLANVFNDQPWLLTSNPFMPDVY